MKVKPLVLELPVEPAMGDLEFDPSRIAQAISREGEVAVRGTSDGRPAFGEGHMEMTGHTAR